MSPLGITLLMLVSFAAFAALTARKLRIVASLEPEVRWDHPMARLRSVLVNGFLQQRMIRREWKAGLMHTVIFLGFMALLLRKLQLLAIGYDETFAGLRPGQLLLDRTLERCCTDEGIRRLDLCSDSVDDPARRSSARTLSRLLRTMAMKRLMTMKTPTTTNDPK